MESRPNEIHCNWGLHKRKQGIEFQRLVTILGIAVGIVPWGLSQPFPGKILCPGTPRGRFLILVLPGVLWWFNPNGLEKIFHPGGERLEPHFVGDNLVVPFDGISNPAPFRCRETGRGYGKIELIKPGLLPRPGGLELIVEKPGQHGPVRVNNHRPFGW